MYPYGLPTDLEKLSQAVTQMIEPALLERNVRSIWWTITDRFLQGVRSFYIVNAEQGVVDYWYDDEFADLSDPGPDDGEHGLPFRWEKAASLIQTEVGRLARLDLGPFVEKKANSLQSLRQAAFGQAWLDHAVPTLEAHSFDRDFLTQLVQYGTIGQAFWPEGSTAREVAGVDREFIPAHELLGIPAGLTHRRGMKAIGRHRLLPLSQLQDIKKLKVPDEDHEDYSKLQVQKRLWGANLSFMARSTDGQHTGVTTGTFRDIATSGGSNQGSLEVKDGEAVVRVTELFFPGPGGTLDGYIIRAGELVLYEENVTESSSGSKGVKVPFPIGIARYHDTDHFYGGSFAFRVIPFMANMERLFYRLIMNVEDLDRFGILMVPRSLGIDDEDILRAGYGPKVVPYDKDILAPQVNDPVQAIQPVNSSKLPGEVVKLGVSALDSVAQQGPLGGEHPRADSGRSFEVLAEVGATHLISTALSLEEAYATVYRVMLYHAGKSLKSLGDKVEGGGRGISLSQLDNSLAGVKVDPNTGMIVLDSKTFPDPWSVNISIRSTDPARPDRERQEAIQLRQQGDLSPLEFAIENYRKNWGFPIAARALWENYLKAVMMNLVLFGDGKIPGSPPAEGSGSLLGNKDLDLPEAHLYATEEFVAGMAMMFASDAVKEVFVERLTFLRASLGMQLPAQMPHPEQAAEQSQVQRQQAEQLQAQAQGASAPQGGQAPIPQI